MSALCFWLQLQRVVAAAVIDDFHVAVAALHHVPLSEGRTLRVFAAGRVGGEVVVEVAGRRGRVFWHFALCAHRAFVVLRLVLIERLHADFVPGVVRGELVTLARAAADRLAVAQPLVLHVFRYAIFVGNRGGEGFAHFQRAVDADRTRVVLLRLRLFGDDRVGLAAGRGFRVFVAVGVGGADGDFVSGIFGLQGVVAVGRARDRLAVAQPLVLDAVGVIAVAVPDFGGEFAADFRLATDVDDAGMVRGRRRGGFAFNLCGFAAGRCFVVRRVVGVARLHADFVADVIAAQHVGFAVCAVYRRAVAQPLVGDVVRYAVVIGDGGGERGVFFCLTRDGDCAGVVGGRRAAFVVNGGGDAVFARLYLPALRLADAHGVVLVALLFAIGDGIDGEGRAVLPFGDGDGVGGGFHIAVVGGAVFDGDVHGDIAVGVARRR